MNDLFEVSKFGAAGSDTGDVAIEVGRRETLDQWFTPIWAAEALYEEHFSDLGPDDVVLEPSAGPGHFLAAIPEEVPAFGVEIDPVLAEQARRRTGRQVLTGDFRTVEITMQPTAIIGNPPFSAGVFQGFLDRAHRLLPEGGRMGLIVPAHVFQTPSRVTRFMESWSMQPQFIPRTLFPGLKFPLVFCVFTRDRRRMLVGGALFREAHAIENMPEHYAETLKKGPGSVWVEVVRQALEALGGEASLGAVYEEIAPRRPTATNWWKEKVRQILQKRFIRTGEGRYALPEALAA